MPSVSHTYSVIIPPNTRKTDNESRKATMNCQVIDLEKKKKIKKSETRMTACVLKQDPNT